MIPPFITLATKTRQLNLYEFTRLNTPVYAGQSSSHSPRSWMHPHFIRGNIDGLCQIKRVEVKSASFTYGYQVSGILFLLPLWQERPNTVAVAEEPLWLQSCRLSSQHPYLAGPLCLHLQSCHLLSSSIISICRALTSHSKQCQCWPILWPGLRLQSCHHQCIAASCPSQHHMSLLTSHKMIWNMSHTTQKMIWNSAYWTC